MKSLYINTISPDACAGSLKLCGAFAKLLSKRAQKIALFRPIAQDNGGDLVALKSFAPDANITEIAGFKADYARAAIANGGVNDILQGLIAQFEALKAQYDFIICLGVSPQEISVALNFDLNLEIAKNLNTPLAFFLKGKERGEAQIIDDLRINLNSLKKSGCAQFGTFVAGLDKDKIAALKSEFAKSNLQNEPFYLLLSCKNAACEVNSKELFMGSIDVKAIESRFDDMPPSDVVTPIMFEYKLFDTARKNRQRIVLPESGDDRILRAAEIIIKKDVADIILLGDPSVIGKKASELKIDLSKASIIDPNNSPLGDKYANELYELRKSKGLTPEAAREAMKSLSYFGTMMVYLNDADGMVSGAIHTTSDTIRPALQIIKTKPDISIISSIFFMCLDTKVYVYGDCAVNIDPTPEQLAQIAISSADTAKGFGIEPKIALLSYSTGNSGEGAAVDKVKAAVAIVREKRPDLKVEGPIQFDAAIEPSVAKTKLPNSLVAGQANVFIFPDLNTGNNTYKAVQRSAGAVAVGPVLQGLKKPVNDLSRGCLVADIVNTVAITAIQAQQIKGS